MDHEIEYMDCQCLSPEHTLRYMFTPYNNDKDPPEIYTEVYLCKQGFWKRIWIAIKYVFGYQCKYGHWDCTILTPSEVPKLQKLLNKYVEEYNKFIEDNTKGE